MCDFSLEAVRSRPAKIGDKLKTRRFSLGTRGLCALEDHETAVCLLPGTELSFAEEVRQWTMTTSVITYKTATFRRVNKDKPHFHHDALEFPNGEIVLLTTLTDELEVTVLQLPGASSKGQDKARAYAWSTR
jgi:hypothetical protein